MYLLDLHPANLGFNRALQQHALIIQLQNLLRGSYLQTSLTGRERSELETTRLACCDICCVYLSVGVGSLKNYE